MTQASEFRTAYELGKSGAGQVMQDNFLLEIIKGFSQDKSLTAFEKDSKTRIRPGRRYIG